MSSPLRIHLLSVEEAWDLRLLARSRKGEARLRERARICWLSHQGQRVAAIAAAVGVTDCTVRRWIHRFNAQGLAGLADEPRAGRPPRYTPEEVGTVIATSLFHAAVNCQMIETANAGRAIGSATKANVRSMPAPSTCAASISSSDTPAKKLRKMSVVIGRP